MIYDQVSRNGSSMQRCRMDLWFCLNNNGWTSFRDANNFLHGVPHLWSSRSTPEPVLESHMECTTNHRLIIHKKYHWLIRCCWFANGDGNHSKPLIFPGYQLVNSHHFHWENQNRVLISGCWTPCGWIQDQPHTATTALGTCSAGPGKLYKVPGLSTIARHC